MWIKHIMKDISANPPIRHSSKGSGTVVTATTKIIKLSSHVAGTGQMRINKNFRHKLECNRSNRKQKCRKEDNIKNDLKYRMWNSTLDSKDSVLGPKAGSHNKTNCPTPQKQQRIP
jgi:hypothetical protein